MEIERQFLNDVVRPWDELNALLALPFAYHPGVSVVTTKANAIAVALKHTAENTGRNMRSVNRESCANSMISDVADAWKHGGDKLTNKARHNSMVVSAMIEVEANGLQRFIRNVVIIDHATFGKQDFMFAARDAIRYWVTQFGMNINWAGHIVESAALPENHIKLFYDGRKMIGMDAVRIQCVERTDSGLLVEAVPQADVSVGVYECP